MSSKKRLQYIVVKHGVVHINSTDLHLMISRRVIGSFHTPKTYWKITFIYGPNGSDKSCGRKL